MQWVQNYQPLTVPGLSPLMAAAPIFVLLGLLVAGVAAHKAALSGLTTALLVAIFGFRMPVSAALTSAGYGACFGLLPIAWIVLAAVFLYHLTVRSGQFEVIKRSVAGLSGDRRIQTLLIAFSFEAFLEGTAGFGAPVAITAALLIGIGFTPLYAAVLALLANTCPVAFGSLGIPILTLHGSSGIAELGISEMALGQMVGRQLTPFAAVLPIWLVMVMSGWKGVKGCWPAILVSSLTMAGLQWVIAEYLGPKLVNVIAGLGSMAALALFLRFWQPAEEWHFPDEKDGTGTVPVDGDCPNFCLSKNGTVPLRSATVVSLPPLTRRQVWHAWMPWMILSATIIIWGVPAVQTVLNGGNDKSPTVLSSIVSPQISIPNLDNVVYRTRPVVVVPEGSDRAKTPERAVYTLNWLSATGTAIFLAAALSAWWLGISWQDFWRQFGETLWKTRWAVFTIACMLALAYTTRYSGGDATMGQAFTQTGWLYPFFAPLLGWVGVALTGSDTSCNALFGSLQRLTAQQLGLNPVLIVASNSTGGVMGKMISVQSIVVAAVATEQSGHESQILRKVLPHSAILALLMGLMTLAQAYWLPGWMIPHG